MGEQGQGRTVKEENCGMVVSKSHTSGAGASSLSEVVLEGTARISVRL